MQPVLCHGLNFVIPKALTPEEIDRVFREFFYIENPPLFPRFGGGSWYYKSVHDLLTKSGNKLISVYANGTQKNAGTTCFSIDGLAFEDVATNPLQLNLVHICQQILANKGHGTNIQLALDSFGGLSYRTIREWSCEDVFEQRIKSRLCSKKHPPLGVGPVGSCKEGITYGSAKSGNYIRIYDKSYKEGTRFPWLRCETVIRQRKDVQCIIKRIAAGEPLGRITAEYLYTFLDFVELGSQHKRYRQTCKWWSSFLGDASKLELTALRYPEGLVKTPASILIYKERLFRDMQKLKQYFPDNFSEMIAELCVDF